VSTTSNQRPQPDGSPFIEIRALTKSYPVQRTWREILRRPFVEEWTPALAGVDLTVDRGEFFGLLGPNGAGKTTLFKVLSTLIAPDSGQVHVAGLDAARDAVRLRRIVSPVIPDERSLLWRLSARENLVFFAGLYGYGGAAREARVVELLDIVGLADAGTKMVGQFSSGMKQRLLIARALLPEPRLLLLDEPTRSLDPVSAQRFRGFLREEIAREQGCTVLLATHNAEEALELCTRVAVLDRGRVRAVGTPEELALRVTEERFRIYTRTPGAPAFGELLRRRLAQSVSVTDAVDDGWSVVEVEIPTGNDGCAKALEYLAHEGVLVARLERVRPTLAQVIEHVVAQHQSAGPEGTAS